jgi:hypothetical protein
LSAKSQLFKQNYLPAGEPLASGLLAAGVALASVFGLSCAAGEPPGEAAGEAVVLAAGVGVATGAGCSLVESITELAPRKPGTASNRAVNIKAEAAPMVIFDKIVCVPRAPKAVVETELAKSAPASALPGCNSTDTINTTQDSRNKANKIEANNSLSS